MLKKYKVIIDTDPGVDDATGIFLALFDKKLDIKLFTVPCGNVGVETGTRNLCHILDLAGKDYPVAKGPKTAMRRVSKDATWLHGKEGLGGYIPPKTTKHKPIKEEACEAMYNTIKQNPHEITIIAFGPHTNIGLLLERHPDSAKLIKRIVFEGAAPFGLPNDPNYISFNASTDPDALKLVMESCVPVVMVPSTMGRFVTHLTEEMVQSLGKINDVGRFLSKMFEIYWEPNAPTKRIATNDTCALFYLEHHRFYKTRRCNVDINVTDRPGDMKVTYCRKGHVKIVLDINRTKFIRTFFKKFVELDDVKLNVKI